jgi:hypothetical protein
MLPSCKTPRLSAWKESGLFSQKKLLNVSEFLCSGQRR